MKTWQLTFPVPLPSRSSSSWTPSVVLTTGAAAMHFLASHRAKIDQKPEIIFGVELFQSHVLGFVLFFHEESAYFAPNVSTFDAVVVQHVW